MFSPDFSFKSLVFSGCCCSLEWSDLIFFIHGLVLVTEHQLVDYIATHELILSTRKHNVNRLNVIYRYSMIYSLQGFL